MGTSENTCKQHMQFLNGNRPVQIGKPEQCSCMITLCVKSEHVWVAANGRVKYLLVPLVNSWRQFWVLTTQLSAPKWKCSLFPSKGIICMGPEQNRSAVLNPQSICPNSVSVQVIEPSKCSEFAQDMQPTHWKLQQCFSDIHVMDNRWITDTGCVVGTQNFMFHLSSFVAILMFLLSQQNVWPKQLSGGLFESDLKQDFFCILGLCLCYQAALFIQLLEAPWKSVLICFCIVSSLAYSSFGFRLQCLCRFWEFKVNTVYELLDWDSWHLFSVLKVEQLV